MRNLIHQSEIEELLRLDITNFIRMKYQKYVFVIENIEPVTMPNIGNYEVVQYKYYIHIKCNNIVKFKISIEYYLKDNDLKFGLFFNDKYDYGEYLSKIDMFNNYLKNSESLINMIKGILQSAKLN